MARKPARYLAPIVLVATTVGVYMIVHAHLTATSSSTSTTQSAGQRPVGNRKFDRIRFYTVQPGDSMTSIAQKTGLPLQTIESLNPSVDPNSLQTGQRVRLRR